MGNNFYKIAALALALVLSAAAIYVFRPAAGQNRFTRVVVSGDSQAKVAPDTAAVTFAVVTQGKQALDAQQENARKSEAVRVAVEAVTANAKIEVKTSDYSLSPERDYSSEGMPKINGYEVKNTVTVLIKDLNQVGAVIDAATKAGANSVEGIRFVLGEASPAQGDALSLATKQAMAKAEAIAKSLNGRIVRVVETIEGGSTGSVQPMATPYSMMSNASANTNYSTPVQAGTLDVRSQVVLVVEVEI